MSLAMGVALLVAFIGAAGCGGESSSPAGEDGAQEGSGQLVIAGYGGVTAPLLKKFILDPFSEETGIEVKVPVVPGQQVAGISAQNEAGNIQWDMALSLAASDMATLLDKGYLATMPKDVQQRISKNITGVEPYGVPSRNGAVQIICNTKLAESCPTNAVELFDTQNHPGPRIFPSFQPLVLIAFALDAAGVPPDQMFPDDPEQAKRNVQLAIDKLNELKPSIKTFYSSSTEAAQLLNRGEAITGGLWNGSATEIEESDRLDLSTTWTDAVKYNQWDVVFKGAPHEENAWKLLAWITDHPEATAKYLEAAPAGTTDPRVYDMLPPDVQKQLPPTDPEEPLAETDAVWYTQNPELKKMIDEFWKDYTQG